MMKLLVPIVLVAVCLLHQTHSATAPLTVGADPSFLMSLVHVRPMNIASSQQHHSALLLDIVLSKSNMDMEAVFLASINEETIFLSSRLYLLIYIFSSVILFIKILIQ